MDVISGHINTLFGNNSLDFIENKVRPCSKCGLCRETHTVYDSHEKLMYTPIHTNYMLKSNLWQNILPHIIMNMCPSSRNIQSSQVITWVFHTLVVLSTILLSEYQAIPDWRLTKESQFTASKKYYSVFGTHPIRVPICINHNWYVHVKI